MSNENITGPKTNKKSTKLKLPDILIDFARDYGAEIKISRSKSNKYT
jgi:hypothetical protein